MAMKDNYSILTKESFPIMCRTCLMKPDLLYKIFDVSFQDISIKDLLSNLISIKCEEDELPRHICETCIIRLCEFRSFKRLCLDSNCILVEALKCDVSLVKEEIDIDPELIIVKGESDPCPECPSSYSLPWDLKRILIRKGKIEHRCDCGNCYMIKYNGICTGTASNNTDESEANPEVLTKSSFSQLCRTCLAKPDIMYQIFDISFKEIPIKDLLKEYISIEVEENDELPKHICEPCTANLCGIYSFKTLCNESESLLQQMLNYNVGLIKEENNSKMDVAIKNESDSDSDHMQKFNDNRRRRTCSVCDKSVIQTSYWRHKQLHTDNKNPFPCPKCPATFSLHCNLKRHIMIHTGERPHLCDHCGKSFIQANTFIEHKRTHTGEKPYECRHCGKRWSQYASYKSHIDKPNCSGMIKQESGQYECSECCGAFSSKRSMKEHNCDYTPLDCRTCGREFITRNALKIHVRTHNEPRQYVCTICNELFPMRQLFTRHMIRHRSTEHICNECGKGFSNYSGLWSHRKIHTGDQPYVCSVCDRPFSQAGSLKSHMLIHTGEKPYTCDVCNKTFTQPNHLKYHLRTHSGEKPYTCNYCGKSFSLNGTLTVHVRIHTGETPYICDICNKGFYDSSSLKKHRQTHTAKNMKQRISEV